MVNAQNDPKDRYCPICEEWMDEISCPKDEVPTIRRETLQEQQSYFPEGTILGGRYKIIRLIGVGGMGEVYLGTQTNMDRRVAIKTLKKEFMSNERLLKRFYREARAAAALDHPNIVKVYDFGLDADQGCPYIAMEYLEGKSLDEVIEGEGQLNEVRTCRIIGAVARALTDAHSKGVIHRDLKPDNVHVQSLSDGTEHVKVLDFGIAKIRSPDGTPTEKLTGTGMALGTPYYMSPEQAMGKPADFRSDLYSLGCMIYQMVAGRMPFDAEQPMAVLLKQLREPAPPLPAMLCDGEKPTDLLRSLYARLMAKNPDERPDSTLGVADRLQECIRIRKGESLDNDGSSFGFGKVTLGEGGASRSDKGNAPPGLETLLRSSVGEAVTQDFAAIADELPETEQRPLVQSEYVVQTDEYQTMQLQLAQTRKRNMVLIGALVAALGIGFVSYLNDDSKTDNQDQSSVATPINDSKVTVRVNSEPSGAFVMDGERAIGNTPLSLTVEESALPAQWRVGLAGFEESVVKVSKQNSVQLVKLTKKASPKVKPKLTKQAVPPTPAKEKASITKPKPEKRIVPKVKRKGQERRVRPASPQLRGRKTTTQVPSAPAPVKQKSKDGMEVW